MSLVLAITWKVILGFFGCKALFPRAEFENSGKNFEAISKFSPQKLDDDLAQLQRFLIFIYDRSSSLIDTNEFRGYLFTEKPISIDLITQTKNALYQHFLRAAYQAG